MATNSQQPTEWDGVASTLNVFIEAFNRAKEISEIKPARAIFGSVAVILATIEVRFLLLYVTASLRLAFVQESFHKQQNYIKLGQHCVDICRVLDRGTRGKRMERLSQSVREAMDQLMTWVERVAYGLYS
jgi:hypothetical protein